VRPTRSLARACDVYRRCAEDTCAAANAAFDRTPGAKPWPDVVREYDQYMERVEAGEVSFER
jgi:hypothetical protein